MLTRTLVMSVGDRLSRLIQLARLLASNRTHDSRQLAELLGVSTRTIFRDLRTLEEIQLRRFDQSHDLIIEEVGCDESNDELLSPHVAKRSRMLADFSAPPQQFVSSSAVDDEVIEGSSDAATQAQQGESPRHVLDEVFLNGEDHEAVRTQMTRLIQAIRERGRVFVLSKSDDRMSRLLIEPIQIAFRNSGWYVDARAIGDLNSISLELTDILAVDLIRH